MITNERAGYVIKQYVDHRLEGCRRLVFDASAWSKVGHDVGDNSCFWKPATIIKVYGNRNELKAHVQFDDGRNSYGHFIQSMEDEA